MFTPCQPKEAVISSTGMGHNWIRKEVFSDPIKAAL